MRAGWSAAAPRPTVAMTVPSLVSAMAPTIGPVLFHDTTGLLSLSRSIAHTASGAPPQPPDVDVYSIVPTAIGSDQRELAGRNGAGFCRSLPDCRPITCSTPLLE